MEEEGWLLDVYITGKGLAVLWMKTQDGRTVRLVDRYTPTFYVKPKGWGEEWELSRLLSESQAVNSVYTEEKYVSLSSVKKEKLIRVEATGLKEYRSLVNGLRRSQLVSALYDADLRHVQKYLFTRLGIEPTSRVKFGYDGERLVWISKVEDDESLPFSLARVEYEYEGDAGNLRIKYIDSSAAEEIKGERREIAAELYALFKERDPDIIILPKCDKVGFPLLKGLLDSAKLSIARYDDGEQVALQGSWGGRIFIGESMIGHAAELWGVAGMVERARFSFLPLGLSARWLSNKSIDSRNCYELMKMGYAIPEQGYFEPIRELQQLLERDRGGISITPISGLLHHNVAALDFDSQYPNIILKGDLSYEKPGLIDQVQEQAGRGLISIVIEPWLRRRLELKKLKKTLAKGSEKRLVCEQRIDALKLILVTSYGISGCCWNRFGNVLTFEEINRRSRDAMLKAKAIAEEKGFEIVYSDVDSLFVKKADAERSDYERLADTIAGVTGLSMSLDKHFKFIAFPRLKNDISSSALKRYFGITYDGEVEARGIELRRDDAPEFVKEFQRSLIIALMNHDTYEDVYSRGVKDARRLLEEALREITEREVDPASLFVTRTLRKEPERYRNRTAHVSAARQIIGRGGMIEPGEKVRFIITDEDNKNALCRVSPEERADYDSLAYCRMVVEAAKVIFEAAGIALPINSPSEGATLLDYST
ncbi:MAG: DNA polymerase domain-containing protein [Conexivisphaerales archaeon]